MRRQGVANRRGLSFRINKSGVMFPMLSFRKVKKLKTSVWALLMSQATQSLADELMTHTMRTVCEKEEIDTQLG